MACAYGQVSSNITLFTTLLYGSGISDFEVCMLRGWRYTNVCLLDVKMITAGAGWFQQYLRKILMK